MASFNETRGVPELQFLPRCAALVQYGGGDGMRQGEALISVPLAASAVPPALRAAVADAVDRAIAEAPGAAAAGEFAAEHVPTSWARDACSWDVALAVSTEPGAGSGWANVYWHGWLFGDSIELDRDSTLSAAQRFPLCGIWEPSCSISRFGDADDARAAGVGCLRAADQHMHKVDPYAGGDREGTIALYMEQGFEREAAEVAVMAAELECNQYHVGSDAARIALHMAVPGGAVCWAACVDLGPPGTTAPWPTPRVQATLLVAVTRTEDAAQWFRRWEPPSGAEAAAARTALATDLGTAGLVPAVADRMRAALLAE